MGKRSDFERVPRDFYPTPAAAIAPLIPHLPKTPCLYHEPCAGNGALISHLSTLAPHILCYGATDIEPQVCHVGKADALELDQCLGSMFITNPPWDRKVLHPLIAHLSSLAPTWLLVDADWMHTLQSALFMPTCVKIVSVGRVKWIPDSTMTGKDNCAWYCFDAKHTGVTEFVGR